MRFVLSAENNDLFKSAQTLTGSIDSAVVLLSRSSSFQDFTIAAGGRLDFENDQEKFRAMMHATDAPRMAGLRSATFSQSGFFAIFEDKRILMSSPKYTDFSNAFKRLRLEVDTQL